MVARLYIGRMGMDDNQREAYEERAAIMEYDGGMSRKEAEREAMEWIREMRDERGL